LRSDLTEIGYIRKTSITDSSLLWHSLTTTPDTGIVAFVFKNNLRHRQKFFSQNRLPQSVVDATSTNMFNDRLDAKKETGIKSYDFISSSFYK